MSDDEDKLVSDYIAKHGVTRVPPGLRYKLNQMDWERITQRSERTNIRAASGGVVVRAEPRNVTKSNRYFVRRPPKKV